MNITGGVAEFWQGAGAATITAMSAFLGLRTRRVNRLEKIRHDILEQVRLDNADLREEVAACRARDEEFVVIKTSLRILVPEVVRRDPANPVLSQIGSLLSRSFGPVDHSLNDVKDLLLKLNQEPGTIYSRGGE